MAAMGSPAKYLSRGTFENFDSNFFHKYATLDYYLSRGSSGNVYGPIQWNKTKLAIKQTTFADGNVTAELIKDLEAKRKIWTSLEHKHLTRIHSVDISQLPKAMFIVMEFAGGGPLQKLLQSLGPDRKLPVDVVREWANQIAEGMVYLHEKNIVHRDLKSSNILLMEPFTYDYPRQMISLKITDFDEVKEHKHTTTMSFVGTFAYMAPEVIRSQRFSKASDVWSYGVVVWEMLSGESPYEDLESTEIIYKSINGKLDNLPVEQTFPEDMQLLLEKCWKSVYEERPSFHEIICVLHCLPTDKYKSYPVLIGTITKESTKAGMTTLTGFTILDKELFVVSQMSSKVEVYDSIEIRLSRRWKLKKLINPMDIVSCNRNKCLYIIDSKTIGQLCEILKVDATGNLISHWSTGSDCGRSLSVTQETNIILTCYNENKLNEYSPDGKLIRVVNLSDAGIRCPYHAIMMTNGHFVVCYGSSGHDSVREEGLSIVNADGNLIKSFNGMCGTNVEKLNFPVYLSVDANGFVFFADLLYFRVLLLDSDLNFIKEILSVKKNELNDLTKILVDEANGRILVADYELFTYERILIFHF